MLLRVTKKGRRKAAPKRVARQQPKETARGRPAPWFAPAPSAPPFTVMRLVADYHQADDGSWAVTLTPNSPDLAPLHWDGLPDAHEALHVAMDHIEDFSDQADVGVATMHMLDGDAVAWAELVAREGFARCVHTPATSGVLLGPDGTVLHS